VDSGYDFVLRRLSGSKRETVTGVRTRLQFQDLQNLNYKDGPFIFSSNCLFNESMSRYYIASDNRKTMNVEQ
jgi:hypothetical protein